LTTNGAHFAAKVGQKDGALTNLLWGHDEISCLLFSCCCSLR
jgi:hypothetical protein